MTFNLKAPNSIEGAAQIEQQISFQMSGLPLFCCVLALQGRSHCLSTPKKSSVILGTFISHLNANVDLYMETWVKGGAG